MPVLHLVGFYHGSHGRDARYGDFIGWQEVPPIAVSDVVSELEWIAGAS